MKKIFSVVGMIIILSPLICLGYVEYRLHRLEKVTYTYLYDVKNYAEKEVLSVKGNMKKLSLFTVEVIFSDEPAIMYDYKMNGRGEIIQIGASDPKDGWKTYKPLHLEE